MLILSENNKKIDTDIINEEHHYSVLRFKDFRNPDFYFEKLTQIEEFTSASIMLEIGEPNPFTVVIPLHWSILCSDKEYIQSIPLYEINGRIYDVFCLNPIDGYMPYYLKMRPGEVLPNMTWTCPPIDDRDMLVVPLGTIQRPEDMIERGPVCAIFSPNRIDVNRPISDIW